MHKTMKFKAEYCVTTGTWFNETSGFSDYDFSERMVNFWQYQTTDCTKPQTMKTSKI